MLPEKDDDGRQVLILRPGDYAVLLMVNQNVRIECNVYGVDKFCPATALYFQLNYAFTVFQPNKCSHKH